MTKHETLRFSAREDILLNPVLSPGSRLLYMTIDHYAGFKGQAFPLQSTVAKSLGVTDRMVRYWLRELGEQVAVIQRRGSAVYVLEWVPVDRKPVSALTLDDRKPVSGLIGNLFPVPSLLVNQEIEQGSFACLECEDMGFRQSGEACNCQRGIEVAFRRHNPRKRA